MRIRYVTNVRLPTAKAQGYAIMKMCSEFAKAGVETELFVPKRVNFELKEDPFEHYGIEKNFNIKKIFNFDLLGKTIKFGPLFYWIDIFVFLFALRFTTRFNSDDVVYTRDFVLASFFSKRQIVCLEIHAIPKSSFLFQRALKRASHFIVLNSYIKKALMDRGVKAEKIMVAPSGVDLKEFPASEQGIKIPEISENDFVYGYVGTLKTMGMEKGVELGLEALRLLTSEYKFLIVGGEIDEVEYYKKIAVSLGVSNRAVFVGKVPHLKRSAYISVCSVLMHHFQRMNIIVILCHH
jgi:glycosyltransferase involved in cell wall biosynthesis